MLKPQEDTTVKEIHVPASMTKTLIFCVDLSEATRVDSEPKKFADLTEDILDSMGKNFYSRFFVVNLEFLLHEKKTLSRCDIYSA